MLSSFIHNLLLDLLITEVYNLQKGGSLLIVMHSLMTRLLRPKDALVQAVCRSEVRKHSLIWHRRVVALGVQWNTIQLY